MKPMHLAMVCETLPRAGLPGTIARRLATDLIDRGHSVSLLCANDGGGAWDERASVSCSGGRTPYFAPQVLAYHRWQQKQQQQITPDRVISLTSLVRGDVVIPLRSTYAGAARALCRVQAPLPVRVRSCIGSLYPALLTRRILERRALSASRRILALTEPMHAELQAAAPANASAVDTVRLPTPLFPEQREQGTQLREQLARALDLPPGSAWLLLPFQSAWVDGIEPVLLALKALIDRGTQAHLLLAGPCRYPFVAWVAHLGLREHVRFVGVPDQLEQLASAADLVVLPTNHDPLGWRVLTALGCGGRVLTTSACGTADRVQRQGGAVVQAPATPDRLLHALQGLLREPQNPDPSLPTDTGDGPAALVDAVQSALAEG